MTVFVVALAVWAGLSATTPTGAAGLGREARGRPQGAPLQARDSTAAISVAVFAEAGFPAVDTAAADPEAIGSALTGRRVTLLGVEGLKAQLTTDRFDVLVLPYGSAFPKDSWPAIRRFLEGGGAWVNLGGAPFAVPMVREDGRWRAESRRTAYHKDIGITQAFAVDASACSFRAAAPASEGAAELAKSCRASTVFEFSVRLTNSKRRPDEDGSDGPREGRVTPLVHAVDPAGSAVAAPFLQIDRLQGRFAGGRWVLATGDGAIAPATLSALVDLAAAGAQELTVRPVYAGFHTGERPQLTVTFTRPGRDAAAALAGPCRVELLDDKGTSLGATTVSLAPRGDTATAAVVAPAPASGGFGKGLYGVRVELPVRATRGEERATLRAESGFWIYDAAMLTGGPALSADKDYFRLDGKPFVATGTTYMASDVHRRFLLEPNPWLWDQDFAAMKAAGVNLVRTGIWTGWKEHAQDDAAPREEVLRSLDVFLLTARAHGIPLIFTFFAFLPESWGGANAYLDPASVTAQTHFVGAIAQRLAGAGDIAWDLINEPSFSSPARLWQCRPNYDAKEEAAWQAWLRETVPAPDDATRARVLADRWGGLVGDPPTLPALDDFGDRNIFGAARPNKAADYRRFAQDAFRGWVRKLSATLRSAGGARQLIAVGQDEGGTGERPSPLFFGDAVDFTTNHTWWYNDDLLWDVLMTRRPGQPDLVEETGLMVYERPDGAPWRDETAAARLLERKLALAIGGGATGFVQWAWNINPFMPSDNEAGIGFVRADGTVREQLRPFVGLSRFLARRQELFTGRRDEDVVLVVPHSQVFSARDLATAATQRAVRVLEYDLHTPVRVVAEHALHDFLGTAKLIVLPSPRVFRQDAWETLLGAVERGATLLVTGSFDRDEYERPVDRSAALGVAAVPRPVAHVEHLALDGGRLVSATYRGDKLERVEKAVIPGDDGPSVRVVDHGAGRIIWSPLPVELSDDDAASRAAYAFAVERAGVASSYGLAAGAADGVLARPIVFEKAVLYTVVNETDAPRRVELKTGRETARVAVTAPAGGVALVVIDRASGAELGRYPEKEKP